VACSYKNGEAHNLKKHRKKDDWSVHQHDEVHPHELSLELMISLFGDHSLENCIPRIEFDHLDIVEALACNADPGICSLHVPPLIPCVASRQSYVYYKT
jgi:hypothetical protein